MNIVTQASDLRSRLLGGQSSGNLAGGGKAITPGLRTPEELRESLQTPPSTPTARPPKVETVPLDRKLNPEFIISFLGKKEHAAVLTDARRAALKKIVGRIRRADREMRELSWNTLSVHRREIRERVLLGVERDERLRLIFAPNADADSVFIASKLRKPWKVRRQRAIAAAGPILMEMAGDIERLATERLAALEREEQGFFRRFARAWQPSSLVTDARALASLPSRLARETADPRKFLQKFGFKL